MKLYSDVYEFKTACHVQKMIAHPFLVSEFSFTLISFFAVYPWARHNRMEYLDETL